MVSQSNYAVAQRVAAGIDPKRLTIILALLEKFAGIRVGNSDVFSSIAGGLKVKDSGTDLALALAIASNILNIAMPKQSLAIGELGLSGELRSVSLLEWRIKEAIRLGFKNILIPKSGKSPPHSSDLNLIKIADIQEAIAWLQDQK